MANAGRDRWWQLLVGSVLLVVGWYLACGLIGFAGGELRALVRWVDWTAAGGIGDLADHDMGLSGPAWRRIGGLLGSSALIPVTLLVVRAVQWRSAGGVLSVVGRLRWSWLLVCAVVSVAVLVMRHLLVVVLSGSDLAGHAGSSLQWRVFGLPGLLVLLLIPLQSAGEEVVFRGWLVQAFGAFMRFPYPGVVASALLFALAHGQTTRWRFAELVLFAVIAGWLTVRTGGLEAGIAFHAVHNLLVILLPTAADSEWHLFLADLITLPAFGAAVVLIARRTGTVRIIQSSAATRVGAC